MQKLFRLITVISIAVGTLVGHAENLNFTTCTVLGFNFYSSSLITSQNKLEPCYHHLRHQNKESGSRILLKNNWIKAISHNYLDENTNDFDWDSSKLIIEFYNQDLGPEMPIGIFSSDSLFSDCQVDCLMAMRHFGLNKSLNIRFFSEQDTTAAFIDYPRANISIFVRRVNRGWNFGIKFINDYSLIESSGQCMLECNKKTSEIFQSYKECLIAVNKQIAIEQCVRAFQGITFNSNEERENRMESCAIDVALWQESLVAIDHRWAYIDQLMLQDNFKSIDKKKDILFANLSSPISIGQLKSKLRSIKPKCQMHLLTIDKIDSLNNNQDFSFDNLDNYCRINKTNKANQFYLVHPKNQQLYIQCDENGRAFLKQCPQDTLFNLSTLVCQENKNITSSRVIITKQNKTKPLLIIKSRNIFPSKAQFKAILASYASKSYLDTFLLNNSNYIDHLEWVDEAPEFDYMCSNNNRSDNNTDPVNLPHPNNPSLYIQCDYVDKAYMRVCPHQYYFGETLKCEKEKNLLEIDEDLKQSDFLEMLITAKNYAAELAKAKNVFEKASNITKMNITSIVGVGSGVKILNSHNNTKV